MESTTTTLPVAVRRDLAHVLRKHVFDGYARSTTVKDGRAFVRRQLGLDRLPRALGAQVDAIADRILERAEDPSGAPSLSARLEAYLLDRYRSEIYRRGGELEIETERSAIELSLLDRHPGEDRMVLLGADGWRYYSRRFGSRPAALRYLCGEDDNGPWAVRVPGTTESIGDAIHWLEPAGVRKARADGKRVLRQGDVYLVENRTDRWDDLPEGHWFDGDTRTLNHNPEDGRAHAPLHVPFKARAYVQRAYGMGRTSSRTNAD
ncbi:MAG: hypothetical protein OXU20_06945 [Myxococcales bacterium]|nr:hypothetical protein [Myxococcales bacterium]MDD9965619.1 hypothetical protein [Myxococcales bacterium]